MPSRIFVLVNVLMALSYSVIGALLILYPESAFSQMMLPSPLYAYALGALLLLYGIFRAWRVYIKMNEDNDEGEDKYSHYEDKH
ncbi:type IV secretory pathway VirB6-like protein [Arcicella rosea]|uniref:hypothetical protein n=1 Tax=Arcicella rosea TaxID=502909 RepID=UPI00345D7572